jgi:hypothetical protein
LTNLALLGACSEPLLADAVRLVMAACS